MSGTENNSRFNRCYRDKAITILNGISWLVFILAFTFLVESCTKEKPKYNLVSRAKKISSEALVFCKKNNFNTGFCFIVDMSVHSGCKRFIIWDFRKQVIVDTGMVSHGCGSNTWGMFYSADCPEFSNTPDSHCSSLGKYRIGERGVSKWGIKVKYNIYGMEKTNNNAAGREIVLHSWDAIYDFEIFPFGTSEGWGCPAVSNNFMKKLDKLLSNSEKPVLLWIVN